MSDFLNKKPLLSIIVPVYNGEKFIKSTIKSLINLNKKNNFEVIFQDSCSKDSTLKIVRKYAKFLKNVKIFVEKDSSQSDGINKGVKKASGEYVTWLCADDLLLKNFELAFQLLKNKKIDVLYGDCIFLTENNLSAAIGTEDYDNFKLLNKRLFIQQPGTCIKKSKWDLIGGLDVNLNWIMDYNLFIELSLLKCKFFRLKEFISVARIHNDAKTSSGSYLRLIEYIKMYSIFHFKNPIFFSLRPYVVYTIEYFIKLLESKKIKNCFVRKLHNLFWKIAKPDEIELINTRFKSQIKHIRKELISIDAL